MSEISAIDGWLEKLAEMTPEVKDNTVKSLVMATKKWRWTPTAGPQFQACFCEADELMAVVAGHKIPENPDDPRIIGETRKYLRDFIALDQATTTARQLYDAMLELYPDRANPGSLWGAANTAKKQT
jgi:hypothetical protein